MPLVSKILGEIAQPRAAEGPEKPKAQQSEQRETVLTNIFTDGGALKPQKE